MGKLPFGSFENSARHFQTNDFPERSGRAQSLSAGLHVATLMVIVFVIASAPATRTLRPLASIGVGNKLLPYIPALRSNGTTSRGSAGSGGGRDEHPARFGRLAARSSVPLVPPRLIHNEQPALPAPPAVFDPNAPANVPVVTNLGLLSMAPDTDSAGRGSGHGLGEGDGNRMGDGNGNESGEGDDHGPYGNVVSPVTCLYCPQPGYTEEARKAKLQGKLLLQVLVGADGRAMRVRVMQGLGMGLDEAAVAAVHAWRFSPGRDASKRTVPTWVTIETRFQLF
jgi:periplasmic protein TonB